MKFGWLTARLFFLVIFMLSIRTADANSTEAVDTIPTEGKIVATECAGMDSTWNENDSAPELDYDWVYLDCFHDSVVNKKCPQTAKAKGYKWAMIKGECARSYWKCYGSM